MQIHEKRRPQLVAAVARALELVVVDHGKYADIEIFDQFIDAQSVLGNDEISALTQIVGENPIPKFAAGFVNEVLEERPFLHSDRRLLTQVLAEVPMRTLAEEFVKAVESLPRKYVCSFALSYGIDSVLAEGGPWPFGAVAKIQKGKEFHDQHPFENADRPDDDRFQLAVDRITGAPSPTIGGAYMSIDVDGYFQRFAPDGPTQTSVESNVKALFGLGIAFGIFKFHMPWRPHQVDIYVHSRVAEGPAQPLLKMHFGMATSRVLRGLSFVDPAEPNMATGPGWQWVKWICDHPKRERLIRAAAWYFDSFGADSVLLQYLQAMICMEILLGDGDESRELSVGSTLKNRCAYLIGTSLAERESIISKIGQIYAVRSKIVHSGLSDLSVKERDLLPTLRWYCARVIHVEAKLLGTVPPPPPHSDSPPGALA